MLWSVKPEVIILKDAAPGLVAFCVSVQRSLELQNSRIVSIADGTGSSVIGGVEHLAGHPLSPHVLARINELIGSAERVCVLFQPAPEETLPLEGISRYARFVSVGGYLVVLNTAIGQPTLGDSMHFTERAIERFLASGAPFVIDRTMNAHLVTSCPGGFLRRLPDHGCEGLHDGAIDALEEV